MQGKDNIKFNLNYVYIVSSYRVINTELKKPIDVRSEKHQNTQMHYRDRKNNRFNVKTWQ